MQHWDEMGYLKPLQNKHLPRKRSFWRTFFLDFCGIFAVLLKHFWTEIPENPASTQYPLK